MDVADAALLEFICAGIVVTGLAIFGLLGVILYGVITGRIK